MQKIDGLSGVEIDHHCAVPDALAQREIVDPHRDASLDRLWLTVPQDGQEPITAGGNVAAL
ncbi:hypothetical protein DAETH_42220 (plasmid) [Deinococcus aetherius]|uniref:Uncharacterized protein n=1 Tax=Deinococcus aetherius TaxID=200252 RepID=A0ABM8AK97_9DEIO|nr:hypothetical protein DAETH_42220 [Deinococcus aetherius]